MEIRGWKLFVCVAILSVSIPPSGSAFAEAGKSPAVVNAPAVNAPAPGASAGGAPTEANDPDAQATAVGADKAAVTAKPSDPTNASNSTPSASLLERPAHIVVIPVSVGNAALPDQKFVEAVAEGLAGNPNWHIEPAKKGAPMAAPAYAELSEEAISRFEQRIRTIQTDANASHSAERVAQFDTLAADLEKEFETRPIGDRGRALYLRTVDGVVQSAVAAGDQQHAKLSAERAALLFPGRKFSEADGLSLVTAALMTAANPADAAKVTFLSRPPGCLVVVNGAELGPAQVTIKAAVGGSYWAEARCTEAQGGGSSAVKKVVAGEANQAHAEMLDVAFEKDFTNDATGTQLRLSTADRRQLEESYARRVAERLNADSVVLVSVGELGGSEWLNARMYLRSGFKNRQGLSRVEVSLAKALGSYLARGDNTSKVLRPEEAARLAAAAALAPQGSQVPTERRIPATVHWYSDVPGWVLTGVGVLAVGVGVYFDNAAADKRHQADVQGRTDPFARQSLRSEANDREFIGSIGLFGGGLMAATGIALLATPDFTAGKSELFVLAPSFGPDGAGLRAVGRF